MTDQPSRAPDQPWFQPASLAMQAAVDGDLEIAFEQIEDIYLAHDWQGVQSSMQIWADWACQAQGITPGMSLHVVWRDTDTDIVTDADATPPEARWAGRLLAARAAMDRDQWQALLVALQGVNVGPYIEQFVIICADQIRAGEQNESRTARASDV